MRREDLNSKSFGWKYFEVSVEQQIMFVISNFIYVYCHKKQIINNSSKIAEMGQDMWKILSMVNWMGAMFTWLLVVSRLHPQET